MITLKEAEKIHRLLIAEFGGATGVRDYTLLDAALKRPFQSFSFSELYPEIYDKAAALLESIIVNHPFIDGNKRTGYFLMRYLLLQNGDDIMASQEEKYLFVMDVASGKMTIAEISIWIKDHLIKA